MKTTVTALGMLAAVASAYNPGRHLHFPRGNGTENLTTLTIKTTQVHTITSCAPTVTNCPAHATGIATLPEDQKVTKVVTDTIVLATTVCPVTDVAKVSSSVIAKASTSGIAPNATITTEIHPTTPPASEGSAKPSLTTKTTDIVTDKTLTMTIGTGSTASVVTSTIHTTIQKTITVPCSEATAAPVTTGEPTTTTTATTKVTRTVTISKAKSTGIPDSTGKGDCPASTVTVTVAKETVTVPASTVYVTVGASSAAEQKPVATHPPTNDKSSNGDKPKGSDKPSASVDCPDSTTTLQTVVTVVPYPSGNGTHPTSGHAKPTGFARLRR